MDKFSELIAQGVASFQYKNVAPETPNTDPIIRTYNNLFGMATDTHMTFVDGRYVITGSLFNDRRATEHAFCAIGHNAVDYRSLGYWSAFDFFWYHCLKGHHEVINGDNCYVLMSCKENPMRPDLKVDAGVNYPPECAPNQCDCVPVCVPECARRCMIARSEIPHTIAEVTTSGDPYHVMECYKKAKSLREIAERLNESRFVKGKWVAGTETLFGLIGNEVYELC